MAKRNKNRLPPGELMVGSNPLRREVVIYLDQDRTGSLTFPPDQARRLAGLLVGCSADLDGGGNEAEMHIFAADCPKLTGANPQPGENSWTFDMPLDNGSRLFLHVGKPTHDGLRDMLAEEASNAK